VSRIQKKEWCKKQSTAKLLRTITRSVVRMEKLQKYKEDSWARRELKDLRDIQYLASEELARRIDN